MLNQRPTSLRDFSLSDTPDSLWAGGEDGREEVISLEILSLSSTGGEGRREEAISSQTFSVSSSGGEGRGEEVFESLCAPIEHHSLSAKEHQPEQKREQRRQTGINQYRPNNDNLLAQQEPSGKSRQQYTDNEADEPSRKKGAYDVKRRGTTTSCDQPRQQSNLEEKTRKSLRANRAHARRPAHLELLANQSSQHSYSNLGGTYLHFASDRYLYVTNVGLPAPTFEVVRPDAKRANDCQKVNNFSTYYSPRFCACVRYSL
jgi:hypothetical protein